MMAVQLWYLQQHISKGSDACVYVHVCVLADTLLSDESTAPGASDDYEITKKYELVCRVAWTGIKPFI